MEGESGLLNFLCIIACRSILAWRSRIGWTHRDRAQDPRALDLKALRVMLFGLNPIAQKSANTMSVDYFVLEMTS